MKLNRRWLLTAAAGLVLGVAAFIVFSLDLFGSPAAESTTTSAPAPTTSTTVVLATTSTTIPPTTTTLDSTRAPLTGLPVEDVSVLERRVVGVKIDNHSRSRPQSGLDAADAVYEIVVEGGLTRFLALFHTQDTEYLGPMRSGRPTDAALMKPLGGVFVISGASHWISAYLLDHGIARLGPGSVGAFRISSRSAPHNLYVDTARIRTAADDNGISDDPPPVMWQFGDLPDDAPEAVTVITRFTESATSLWRWNGVAYERGTSSGSLPLWDEDRNEVPFVFDGVIVLRVEQYTARPPRPSDGTPVPASRTVGSGDAAVFSRGRVVEGTWLRPSESHVFELVTESGDPLLVPPGRYWIALVPTSGSVTWE